MTKVKDVALNELRRGQKSIFRSRDEVKVRRKKRDENKPERVAESSFRDFVVADGGVTVKLNLRGQRSWPDRLVFGPKAKIRIFTCRSKEDAQKVYGYMKKEYPRDPFMIEFKRNGEDLTELQRELQVKIGETKP